MDHSRLDLARIRVVVDVGGWVSIHMHEAGFLFTPQLLFKLIYLDVHFYLFRTQFRHPLRNNRPNSIKGFFEVYRRHLELAGFFDRLQGLNSDRTVPIFFYSVKNVKAVVVIKHGE